MGVRGNGEIAVVGWCAAAPGSAHRRASALPTVAGATLIIVTAATGFGWRGRSPREPLRHYIWVQGSAHRTSVSNGLQWSRRPQRQPDDLAQIVADLPTACGM